MQSAREDDTLPLFGRNESQRNHDDGTVDFPLLEIIQIRRYVAVRAYLRRLYILVRLVRPDDRRRIRPACQPLLMDSPGFLRASREDVRDGKRIGDTSSVHGDFLRRAGYTSRLKVRIRARIRRFINKSYPVTSPRRNTWLSLSLYILYGSHIWQLHGLCSSRTATHVARVDQSLPRTCRSVPEGREANWPPAVYSDFDQSRIN